MGVVHTETWQWYMLAGWGPTDLPLTPEWVGACYCSVCGSCPPEALEAALDDGIEVQWCAFLDAGQTEVCFYAEELPAVTYEADVAERESNRNYYRHVVTYSLAHLWELEPADRKRVLDKLVVAADADPVYLYDQYGVTRD